jgi:sporulation protein YlmC with PRC-barrel domain
MILSDLLGSDVVAADGRSLGGLVDVRLEIAGTPAQLLAETVVVGILVSPRSRFSTWGFERRGADAPAIVARPQHWLHRGMFLVDWRDVAIVDEGRVVLRTGAEHLDPSLSEHPRSR